MTVLGQTRSALTGGVLVVVDAGRLLVRHFPALLTVFLLGLACRNGVLWAAVRIGRDHPVVASLLVPLAPLAMVITLVVMLRIAGGALTTDTNDGSMSRRVALLTSALVPFLAVYTVTGELTKDREQFVNESFADEKYRGTMFSAEGLGERSIVDFPHLQVILLVVFLVIRLTIDVLDLEERHTAWGLVQVLVEVTWLTLFANFLANQWQAAREWVGDLVVVTWVEDAWRSGTGWLGPLTDPLRAVGDVFSETLDQVGPIVVTPVAWLAVGAVVLVGGLPADARPRVELPGAAGRFHEKVMPGLHEWRSRRSRWASKMLELVSRRFGDLVDGLRILVHAGLLPVLTFCLVLPLARLAEWGTAEGLRAILGPRDPETMILFSRYPDILLSAVHTLVIVVLVVAAVDRLLLRRTQERQPVTVG